MVRRRRAIPKACFHRGEDGASGTPCAQGNVVVDPEAALQASHGQKHGQALGQQSRVQNASRTRGFPSPPGRRCARFDARSSATIPGKPQVLNAPWRGCSPASDARSPHGSAPISSGTARSPGSALPVAWRRRSGTRRHTFQSCGIRHLDGSLSCTSMTSKIEVEAKSAGNIHEDFGLVFGSCGIVLNGRSRERLSASEHSALRPSEFGLYSINTPVECILIHVIRLRKEVIRIRSRRADSA